MYLSIIIIGTFGAAIDFGQLLNYYEPIFQTQVPKLHIQTQHTGTQHFTAIGFNSHKRQGTTEQHEQMVLAAPA